MADSAGSGSLRLMRSSRSPANTFRRVGLRGGATSIDSQFLSYGLAELLMGSTKSLMLLGNSRFEAGAVASPNRHKTHSQIPSGIKDFG